MAQGNGGGEGQGTGGGEGTPMLFRCCVALHRYAGAPLRIFCLCGLLTTT